MSTSQLARTSFSVSSLPHDEPITLAQNQPTQQETGPSATQIVGSLMANDVYNIGLSGKNNNIPQIGTVYLPDTGTFNVQDPTVRFQAISEALQNARPGDSIMVEVLTARGYNENNIKEVVKARNLSESQEPNNPDQKNKHIEAWLSGFYPTSNSDLGKTVLSNKASLGGTNDGTGRLVPDLLNPAVQNKLKKYAADASSIPGTSAIVIDDHFSVPSVYQRQIENLHGDKEAVRSKLTNLFGQIADTAHKNNRKVVLSISGSIDDAYKSLQDPEKYINKGYADVLDVQIYSNNKQDFNKALTNLENHVKQSPGTYNKLQQIRISLAGLVNGKAVDPNVSQQQADAVKAFADRIHKEGLKQNVEVKPSVFDLKKFYHR